MECPHGFPECIKKCYTPTCRDYCQYSEICCKEYCFFYPGSILSDIQQGKVDNHPHVAAILKAGKGEVLEILSGLCQERRPDKPCNASQS